MQCSVCRHFRYPKVFRYVRFVSTGDSRCNIAELEFYGHEGEGDDSCYYQPTNLATVIVNTVDAQKPYDKEHDIKSNISQEALTPEVR